MKKITSDIQDFTSRSFTFASVLQYKDIAFSILFLCQLITIIGLAFSFGITALVSDNPDVVKIDEDGNKKSTDHDSDSGKIMGGIFLVVVMGGLFSIAWVHITATMASKIVILSLSSVILVNVFGGVGLFAMGSILGGLALLLFALFSFVFFLYVRSRIDFVAANLKVGCKAVLSMPSIILYAIVVLGVQILWCVLWFMAAYGVATNESITTLSKAGHTYDLSSCTTYKYQEDFNLGDVSLYCSHDWCSLCICEGEVVKTSSSCFSPSVSYGKYFALLLSLYWTSAVLSNIVHCATAGAVAVWWFHGTPASSSGLVRSSILRTVTALLGPVCFGSLVVAVIRTTRSMLHVWVKALAVESSSGSSRSTSPATRLTKFCNDCLLTALAALDRAVQYFNHYAFCYVSIYDLGFVEASGAVVSLFCKKGFTTLVNDNLLDNVLSLGHMVVGVLCMLIAYGYAAAVGFRGSSPNTFVLVATGFVAGFFMCMLTLNVISSATATVYVCFAENPASLQTHHPELFDALITKWRKFYPEAELSSGDGRGQPYVPPDMAIATPAVDGKHNAASTYHSLPLAAGEEEDDEENIDLRGPLTRVHSDGPIVGELNRGTTESGLYDKHTTIV
mmetsp:Transcript_21590/g.31408  ORF Transcript_21590/g.31408 Transcript_21590/m.31408 type:complete len:619 (+) Transcript_21590:166-2022(+)|eukprot:CAMPEP_0185028008 /NCGR_PEP_ID=MMETSP1103-20130426/13405_1 /TAXON_ID=36769 /ORGANISM="Paraphysomonas bandaiensis, Strain Caron Lab Isolate" /LENGTH=618 /DNA_ID=CAMNT_0027562235 /DNA_START=65 /DNA_END=1921 /DNA_ORIENTATION=-